jgi:exodeoxyribonuclease V beta subunit
VPVPLAEFPASADAGLCFHAIFEHHDFANDDALAPLVADRLQAFGFDRPRWTVPVDQAVRRVLDARIGVANGPTFRLRDVPRHRRITELRFDLPACGGARPDAVVTPAALGEAFVAHPGGALDESTLAEYAKALSRLGFAPLRGFLTGAIDLLAEHDGRWWVVDWKSNRLGPDASDYASARLSAEMTEAHYVLQYHLYLVAVHRWLRTRVRGYDYDTHVGGACYPFVRGVGAGDDPTLGLFVDRPPKSRIVALDRLFAEGA